MKLDKKFLYWLFLIAVGYIIFIWSFVPSSAPSSFQMTATQAQITQSAVKLVISQIEAGKVTSYDAVISALNAELPSAVRDEFVSGIDTSDFNSVIPQLNDIVASIEIVE